MPGRRYPRTARVNELVREVIAEELERLSDPRLGLATVTGVDVTGDLRNAIVYYSVLGPAEQHAQTAAALEAASSHLRQVLGQQVRMKYLPKLHFREDPAIAQGQRVEELLREINEHGHILWDGDDEPADRRDGDGDAKNDK
jgi:ribosome-binding factor A